MTWNHTLLLTGAPPLHWALAGAGLGLVTLALLFFTGHRLGISTGFESVCALVSRLAYFRRSDLTGHWRLFLLLGLALGGALSSVLAPGGWSATMSLGVLDTLTGWGSAGKLAWMFGGGLCIGFGTRLAGGCTSGHGIFGMSNFEPASWITTLSYMGAGLAMTRLVHHLLAGA